jgi:hypothetical protein
MSGQVIAEPALIDLAPEQPIFADGVTHIRISGDNFQFAFWNERMTTAGDVERVITARLVLPIAAVAEALPAVFKMLPVETQQSLRRRAERAWQ